LTPSAWPSPNRSTAPICRAATGLDLDAEEVWQVHILLTRVEQAFHDLKSPLAERPV
jgi:hypothetical protein